MENVPKDAENVIIEPHRKFSTSCLWQLQRDYFDQAGINAWVNQVPFYITSNPFIASVYARTVVSFIRDTIARDKNARQQPFYILELGTGSGRFSFYVLKALTQLLQLLDMGDITFCYIMSDFTKSNIKYYETHPALLPYLERGVLDFALVNLETGEPITLLKKGITLNPQVLTNPLIVFANYIFDTISHDAFYVENGKLSELLLSVSTTAQNLRDNSPLEMDKLNVDYKTTAITAPYYQDKILDDLLDEYKNTLKKSSFLFPIGSIRALKFLKTLANDKIFVVASDKGYSTPAALDNLAHPSLSFHGSFSMMVNFHALANYCKNTGGDYFLPTPRKGIKTLILTGGIQLEDLPLTRLAIAENIQGFNPAEYFTLHRRMSETFEECALDTLAAHMNLSQWDPHIYMKIASRVNKLATQSDVDTIEFLASNMQNIANNYYYMPKSDCVLFEIAVFFHTIKRYAQALQYYQEAQFYLGEQFGLYYNMGLCQNQLNMLSEALLNFENAIHLDATSKETQEWITYLKKALADKKS